MDKEIEKQLKKSYNKRRNKYRVKRTYKKSNKFVEMLMPYNVIEYLEKRNYELSQYTFELYPYSIYERLVIFLKRIYKNIKNKRKWKSYLITAIITLVVTVLAILIGNYLWTKYFTG